MTTAISFETTTLISAKPSVYRAEMKRWIHWMTSRVAIYNGARYFCKYFKVPQPFTAALSPSHKSSSKKSDQIRNPILHTLRQVAYVLEIIPGTCGTAGTRVTCEETGEHPRAVARCATIPQPVRFKVRDGKVLRTSLTLGSSSLLWGGLRRTRRRLAKEGESRAPNQAEIAYELIAVRKTGMESSYLWRRPSERNTRVGRRFYYNLIAVHRHTYAGATLRKAYRCAGVSYTLFSGLFFQDTDYGQYLWVIWHLLVNIYKKEGAEIGK